MQPENTNTQPNDEDLQNINLGLAEKPELEMSDNDKPARKPKRAKKKAAKEKKPKAPRKKWSKKKKIIVWSTVAVLLIGAGAGGYFLYKYLTREEPKEEVVVEKPKPKEKYYSVLSGEEIESNDLNSAPTYCVQVPNGLDGARPQVGLEQAPIIFEAIAEAGITRFAAIFQNPTASAIGPIRSLRQYYLEWDDPFNCTVVHAGGSDEALSSLSAGGYRDLTEDYAYQWRDYSAYMAPNNLFTSSKLLAQFNADHGYETSEVKAPARMKPADAEKARKAAIAASEDKVEENEAGDEVTVPGVPLVSEVKVNFGYTVSFNTAYYYDAETGAYARYYADGVPHMTYTCEADLEEPRPQHDCGEAKQLAPKAVAVMVVNQYLDTDGYHLVTQTTGTGEAYVFQNGQAFKGTWTRQAVSDVLVFHDEEGNKIEFAPGQLWISAIPSSTGSVSY